MKVGVTVIVPVIGAFVALVAVKLGILPVPLAASPIAVLLLVQLKIVPATDPVNVTGVVALLLHTTWFAGWFTSGIGSTVTVAVIGVPEHPLLDGVIVKVTVTGALVVLVSVPLILPEPLAAIPVAVAVLSLVQL